MSSVCTRQRFQLNLRKTASIRRTNVAGEFVNLIAMTLKQPLGMTSIFVFSFVMK